MTADPATSLYVEPEPGRTVRIAILLGPDEIPDWLRTVLEPALALSFVELVALISTGKASGEELASLVSSPSPIPTWTLAELDGLRELRPDIILDLDSNSAADRLPDDLRSEVWRVRLLHRKTAVNDITRGHLLTSVVIEHDRADRGKGQIVYRSIGNTPLSFWRERNRIVHRATAVTSLGRALRVAAEELHLSGEATVRRAGSVDEPNGAKQVDFARDRLLPIRCVASSLRGNVVTRFSSLRWRLAWRRAGADTLPGMGAGAPFSPVTLPDEGEYADPFLVEEGDNLHLFFERNPPGESRGELGVGVLDRDGVLHEVRSFLRKPYHISYPHVFAWKGDYWMVPETSEAKRVDLYRCEQFPDRWNLEATLLEGHAMTDSTLIRQNGLWYMFVTVDESGLDAELALFVFMAEELTGPWRPHLSNPVRTDICNTRGGGAFVRHNGQLFRPAQDGSGGYGSALTFQRVLQLDQQAYREERASRFRPQGFRGLAGCHSFTACGDVQLIDVRLRRWHAS